MRDLLARFEIDRIVTSPHVRCVETVGPIARARRLEVEQRTELEPDAALADILALLAELPETTLVCTHREVIERLFSGEISCEKGGCLRLERRRGRLRAGRLHAASAERSAHSRQGCARLARLSA